MQPISCTKKEPSMDVTREITLPVDPETAWAAVTDLERWLTDDGSLELEPGAEGELTLRDGETRWATVEEVRAGEHLSFWWHAPDALATLVEVSLVAVDDGTRVVVVESGYAGQPVCGSPWAGGASSGPRARSAAAATASPSFAIGRAYVLTTLDWEPALERLRCALELVEA
jgi:Activator of Hsp90 ATPase homolog 1-like protein